MAIDCTDCQNEHLVWPYILKQNVFIECFISKQIRDGRYGFSKLIDTLCGHKFPNLIFSSDRYLWLLFRSDDNIEYGGFEGYIEFIDRPQKSGKRKHAIKLELIYSFQVLRPNYFKNCSIWVNILIKPISRVVQCTYLVGRKHLKSFHFSRLNCSFSG